MIKELRLLNNSNFVFSFKKEDRKSYNLNIGDLCDISIIIISKAFLCNKCKEKILVDINVTKLEDVVECHKCYNNDKLKNLILYEEYFKELKGGR